MSRDSFQILGADGQPLEPDDDLPLNMETTESGLSVPLGTVKKKQRTIINDEWKLWRRALVQMNERGIHNILICHECGTTMGPKAKEKALECKCTTWRLPGWQAEPEVEPIAKPSEEPEPPEHDPEESS